METVLRKVSVKDRLPKNKPEKDLVVGYNNVDIKKVVLYYDDQFVGTVLEPDYWYEEVSVDELAKERYEKALKMYMLNKGFETDYLSYYFELTHHKATQLLKIAAGLKEDVV